MTLPASGEISMRDILMEKLGNPSTFPAATNVSLRGLASDSYNDYLSGGSAYINIPFETYQNATSATFNPGTGMWSYTLAELPADPKLSEFYSLWGFTLGRMLGEGVDRVNNVGSSYFTHTDTDSNGNAKATTTLNIHFATSLTTFSYGGSSFSYYADLIKMLDHSYAGPATTGTTGIGLGLWNSKRTQCTKLEARWILVDVSLTYQGDANAIGDGVYARIEPGGSYSDQQEYVIPNSLSSGDWTGAWKEITPAILGGSGGNICYTSLGVHTHVQEGEDGQTILDGGSSGYAALQIRINGQDNQIHTYKSNSGVLDLEADAYEYPSFTCIMPDMKVYKEGSGLVRIGDIVVGDRILARGDLDDATVADQYVEVTEARTHNRPGYWDMDGLHITNDHPIYLTDDATGVSHWAPIEAMLQATTEDGRTCQEVTGATYQKEDVDPVYLGTNPGWYYVYHTDTTVKSTVSGDYAPTTG